MSYSPDVKKHPSKEVVETERLIQLNSLSFSYSRTDPQRGLLLCAEAQILAVGLHDVPALAESLRTAAWCHETLSQYEEAQSCAEKSLGLSRELKDPIAIGSGLNALAVISCGRSMFGEALAAALEAIHVFESVSDVPGLASAYNNLGMIYQGLSRYPQALEAYLSALRLNEERGDEVQAAANIGNISNVYYYMGDMDRSFEYDQKALAVARSHGKPYNVAHALESIASHYKQRGDLAAALQALNEALAIALELKEKRYECAIRVKLGTVFEVQHDKRRALSQYKKAALIAESVGRVDAQVNAELRMGMLVASDGDHEGAIVILKQGLAHAEQWKMEKMVCDFHGRLAQSHAALRQFKLAYDHMLRHSNLLPELYGNERQRTVAEMQARFDVERSERAREVLQLKNQHLEETMEARSRELTSMAMRLVQKNTFLQKLRKDIVSLTSNHPASKSILDTLLSDIVSNLRGVDEWERFEQEFQLMHQDFLKTLSKTCPRLTPAELKVCAMLKINLSNKEIANLLSVSLRNVESHRYSIRKKLGLTSTSNLTAYFISL